MRQVFTLLYFFSEPQITEHDCDVFASLNKNVPWDVSTGFKHYNLARVQIVGFYSTIETILTFIRHLLEAAVNLNEICMLENARPVCDYCDCTDPEAGSRFPRTDQDKDAFRKRITDDDGRSTAAVKIRFQS